MTYAVVNVPKGDAIKAKGVDNIKFIKVKTEWTGGQKKPHSDYGLYPVESRSFN